MTFDQIILELKKKIYHPVYFLQGEEPYYIDQISDFIESNILSDSEKEFNQSVLYGKDVDLPTLISYARRYPMMSSHQVVILKEAQEMRSLIKKDSENKKEEPRDLLLEYIQNPTKSTILVICYKYKKLDKRTKVAKELLKHSLFFDSAKMYDDKLPGWITSYVLSRGYRIDVSTSNMIAEYLGNDLSKIANEIGKLLLNLKPGEEITAGMVQENIGISKDFNIFELTKVIGTRNIYKSNLISNHLSANPKSNPFILSITQLYSYFMKILMLHKLDNRSRDSIAAALGVSSYFVPDYETAARNYSLQHCIRNIGFIRDYDLRAKGVNNESTDDGQLLKELLYKILH